ncbi:MAG: ribosomal-processing cysteine protease Prp [Oscillospiraceae bacterium]|nr:ribosomal-processing cysteine protease Prp [Oscillospiraceae bacterium]
MTTANFFAQGSRLTGFTVQGHSGLAPEGEDVLCAAVTSAVRLVECAVNDVLGLECPVKVRRRDAFISLKLPAGLEQSSETTCQTLLEGLMVYFCQLHEEYPEHFIVFHHDSMEV